MKASEVFREYRGRLNPGIMRTENGRMCPVGLLFDRAGGDLDAILSIFRIQLALLVREESSGLTVSTGAAGEVLFDTLKTAYGLDPEEVVEIQKNYDRGWNKRQVVSYLKQRGK